MEDRYGSEDDKKDVNNSSEVQFLQPVLYASNCHPTVNDGGDQKAHTGSSCSTSDIDVVGMSHSEESTLVKNECQWEADIDAAPDFLSRKQRLELLSPEKKKYLRYHSPGKPSMRNQLLVQRTFSPYEEKLEPRTSSPMRKTRVCSDYVDSNSNVNKCSPSSHSLPQQCALVSEEFAFHTQQSNVVPLAFSVTDTGSICQEQTTPVRAIFKTPIRTQHPSCSSNSNEYVTPSRPILSLFSSPASGGSSILTPGAHFVNPFDLDHDRLHLPSFSPSVLNVATTPKNRTPAHGSEGFWSVEHRAILMPVEINDSAMKRQIRHQRRIDKEKDAKVQQAINAFFTNNEFIVPSPWSEKTNHVLPRTQVTSKSSSCQTTLSVPPDVDLLAELGGKYQLLSDEQDTSPPMDSLGNSFIRRKLLNQLNENDSEILASPALPPRLFKKSSSTSPSPVRKQSTPEWEHQTPRKYSAGHFSSGPIREEPNEKGHHHTLSESDLLASPELSPIAGHRSMRSPPMYFSDQDGEHPRPIMQLDFSSILDEDSEKEDNEEEEDNLGTLIQKAATDSSSHISTDIQPLPSFITSISQDNETTTTGDQSISGNKGINLPQVSGMLSSETTIDGLNYCSHSSSGAQLLSRSTSQDTGYQTIASSLGLSCSNTASLEGAPSTSMGPSFEGFMGFGGGAGVSSLTEIAIPGRFLALDESESSNIYNKEPVASASHCDLTSEFTQLKYKSECSFDGKTAGISTGLISSMEGKESSAIQKQFDLSQSDTNNFLFQRCKRKESGLVRKIRALSDVRITREKKRVSRDLTHSFNMNCSAKSDELRRSFTEPCAIAGHSFESGVRLKGLDVSDIQMRSFDLGTGSDRKMDGGVSETSDISMRSVDFHTSLSQSIISQVNQDSTQYKKDERIFDSVKESSKPLISDGSNLSKTNFILGGDDSGDMISKDSRFSNSCNDFQSDHFFGESSSRTKQDNVNTSFQSRFSLEDDGMLEHARQLLGKSEQMRKRHSEQGLAMMCDEALHQGFFSADENIDPSGHKTNSTGADKVSIAEFGITSPQRVLESIESNINSIGSSMLASEIAAEILKRAGDDLATVSEETSLSPR